MQFIFEKKNSWNRSFFTTPTPQPWYMGMFILENIAFVIVFIFLFICTPNDKALFVWNVKIRNRNGIVISTDESIRSRGYFRNGESDAESFNREEIEQVCSGCE